MADPNADFDQISASTIKNYTPKFTDNVFGARVFLDWLKRKARVNFDGGETIVKPLMYDGNDTVAFYNEWDALDTTPQEGFTAAEYPWRQLAGTLAWSGRQNATNAGREKIISLLEAKMNQLQNQFSTTINAAFHTASPASNGPSNLPTLIDATSTIGGIDSSANAFWQSHVEGTFGNVSLDGLGAFVDAIALGTPDVPDLLMTTSTIYEGIIALLQGQQRFQDPETVHAGFQNVLFRGIPVVWDPDNASGVIYALNSKYLELTCHSSNWMRQTDWIQPHNADAKFKQMICYFNLVTNQRRRLGKATGVTVA